MQMNDLVRRLSNVEDSFTERKLEGARPEELRRTLVAFANSLHEGRTAVLFIGVTENAELKGVRNPDSLQKKIRSLCERDCYPPIKYSCEVLNIDPVISKRELYCGILCGF
jgi:Schlafen, AlbA_2